MDIYLDQAEDGDKDWDHERDDGVRDGDCEYRERGRLAKSSACVPFSILV